MDCYAVVTPIPSVPTLDALTYRVPDELRSAVVLGARVLVPLGRRRVTGVVTLVGTEAPAHVTCRDVGAVLDDEPILNAGVLTLLAWIAEYYEAPLADVVSLAVGRGLTAGSKRFVRLLDPALARAPFERQVIDALSQARGPVDAARLRRTFGAKPVDAALRALSARGAVAVDQHLVDATTQELNEAWVEICRRPDEILADQLFGRAPKRRELYEFIARQPGRSIAVRKLAEVFPAPSAQIAALVEAGVLGRSEREVYRDLVVAPETVSHAQLSTHQEQAVEAIVASLGAYAAFLLQGVTASGKTEVYLQAIAAVLAAGRDALVLVPEISLTHQVVARLVGRFGPTVAVLHSELSAGERWDQWRRIRRREVRIVVGARSAVLAPIDDLGIIVVDEEHDAAFKQEDGVRYNARDVAVVRATQAGCPIVLGSATPSIESWRSAREGRYRHLLLPERVTGGPLPSVEVVDLRGRDIEATGGLSEHLATLMRRNLDDGGQTLLFLNRRGYAASLQCYECGEILECGQCSVGMTLHRTEHRLRCHHCDSARAVPQRCPDCGVDALVAQGIGTQRLEASVRSLLASARVARLDRDTAARKGTTRDVLAAWRAHELDVLIGTQMISKGHDAPGVTLVGVVLADLSLGVPDFRAAERTFQLLSQVAGRAGRGQRRGRVIVQTYRPDHFAIAAAVRHDFETFATLELAARAELGYPPHVRMALVRIDGTELGAVEQAAAAVTRSLTRLAQRSGDMVVRGPAPAPIEKRKSRYRFQVQLRARDGRLVRHGASECRRLLAEQAKRLGVRITVDIDPIDMM